MSSQFELLELAFWAESAEEARRRAVKWAQAERIESWCIVDAQPHGNRWSVWIEVEW